jgi:hypothetical protein
MRRSGRFGHPVGAPREQPRLMTNSTPPPAAKNAIISSFGSFAPGRAGGDPCAAQSLEVDLCGTWSSASGA